MSRNKQTPEGQRAKGNPCHNVGKPPRDAEILKAKGIKSPNLAKMKYRYGTGKTVRFFATKEKFEKFMKKQIQ